MLGVEIKRHLWRQGSAAIYGLNSLGRNSSLGELLFDAAPRRRFLIQIEIKGPDRMIGVANHGPTIARLEVRPPGLKGVAVHTLTPSFIGLSSGQRAGACVRAVFEVSK